MRVCVCVSSKVASEKFDMIYKIFLGPMKTVGQVTAKQSSLKERRDDDDDGDEREEEEKKKKTSEAQKAFLARPSAPGLCRFQ